MAAKGVSYNQLLAMGIPKPTLHGLLHKLMLAKSNVTTSPKISPEQRTSKVEENNKGQIVLPLFAVGGWTNARQGFGSSLTFFLSFLCQEQMLCIHEHQVKNKRDVNKKGKKKKLSPSKITYESLLAMGIPKPTLHGLLHKLLLAKSNVTKHTYHPSTKQLSANSNSEKEPTAQSTFSSLTCAGEYPLNKVLDLPNPTQASTNKTSEIQPTAQSTFSSLRFAGRVHSAVKIKKQLLNMVTAVGCEMARQNALHSRIPNSILRKFVNARKSTKQIRKHYYEYKCYVSNVRVCLDFFSFFFVSRQKRRRFTNTDKYLKKNELKGKKKKLNSSEITYESLLALGIPKPPLHSVLHKLVLAKSYSTKHTHHPSTKQLSANSNSEIEPTAQSIFHSLPCAGEYPINKVLDLPNPTQASTNKTSEIEPTAQSTFSSLRFAGRVHSAVKIKKQLLNMVTAVGCEMARQNARRVRVCLDFFSFFFVSRQKRKRFTNTDKYLKKNELKGKKKKLNSSEITYESLLALGIPMPTLHRIMHQMLVGNLSMNNHRNFPRHPYRIWHYYKNLQLKNRLSTYTPSNNSLSLLKTNFAKKPKNPV